MDFLKVSFHCQDRELELRARCPGMLQLDAWEQPAALSEDLWGYLENKAQNVWKSRGFEGY